MSCKSQAHDALGILFSWEGVLPKMIVDSANEMRLGEFAQKYNDAMYSLWGTEPYSPWSNSTKREIRELKKGAARKLTRSGAPRRLWCFALEYESYVRSHTAHDIFQLDGHVPKMVILGETADISPFCKFGFWDWVKFRDKGVAFPDDQMVLGKYLGPSIDARPAMMQHVMKAKVNRKTDPPSASSCQRIGDTHELARVFCQKCGLNGVPVGTAHKQPDMDTHVYEVHFLDGRTKELAANTIAEVLHAQFDPDGNQYVMLDTIVDYRKNPNVAISQNDHVKIVNGTKVISCSTRGRELCCEWKDGSTSWQKLSYLKESHLLQVAEFALAEGIADELAWVIRVLQKSEWFISLVKHQSTRYHKWTHKFGIQLNEEQ
ncbi:hypothetical protein ACHAW6_013295 [Cyclotella cf. meneghiniana]